MEHLTITNGILAVIGLAVIIEIVKNNLRNKKVNGSHTIVCPLDKADAIRDITLSKQIMEDVKSELKTHTDVLNKIYYELKNGKNR